MNDFSPTKNTASKGPADIGKKRVCAIDGATLYLVDGAKVRDNLSADFVGGGNWRAYRTFVPLREYWIEDGCAKDPSELVALLVHEAVECAIMRTGSVGYADAHRTATLLEDSARPCGSSWEGAPTGARLKAALEALSEKEFGRRADDRARAALGAPFGKWLAKLAESVEA